MQAGFDGVNPRRAATLDDAIRAHGGQATRARDAFAARAAAQRAQICVALASPRPLLVTTV
jgi:CxxC motif-containing protein (DUF1111 family)